MRTLKGPSSRRIGLPRQLLPLSGGRIWGAFAFGIGLVIAGFLLEDWLGPIDTGWRNLLGLKPAIKTDAHGLTFGLLVVLLLKELGVAFLVASIIGLAIDKQAEERDTQRAEDLRQAIATDAVFTLFGLSHDQKFIQAVVDCNLKAEIVRSNMTMVYKLRALTEDEAVTVLPESPAKALERFVILDMESIYTFKNVSSARKTFQVPIAVARRRGEGARAVTRATFVRFNDEDKLSDDAIHKAIVSDVQDDFLSYEWTRHLGPDEELRVVSNVMGLKEQSDNEVWGSFFPTMGDVSLELHVLPGMNAGARSLSNGHLEESGAVPTPNKQSWTLSGPLLRHNSVVFW